MLLLKSNTLATSCEELTHWKRPWCWVGLGAGGEGDDRGWDSWMASRTRWTWVWVDSGSWWWTGQGGLAWCDSWGRNELDMTERLNWTDLKHDNLEEGFLNAGSQTVACSWEACKKCRRSNFWVYSEAQEAVLWKASAQVDLDSRPGLGRCAMNT